MVNLKADNGTHKEIGLIPLLMKAFGEQAVQEFRTHEETLKLERIERIKQEEKIRQENLFPKNKPRVSRVKKVPELEQRYESTCDAWF